MKKLCTCMGLAVIIMQPGTVRAERESELCTRKKHNYGAQANGKDETTEWRAQPTRCMGNNNKRRNNVVQYYNEPTEYTPK